MKDADMKGKGGNHQEGKVHFRKKAATKTRERDNNQLPMIFSEA